MTRPFYPKKSELPLLLDGRQTAIVRPMQPQPEAGANIVRQFHPNNVFIDLRDSKDFPGKSEIMQRWNSSLGGSGDILWCKERWWSDWKDEAETEVCYAYEQQVGDIGVEWNPSITMPKSACRLWLQVLEVKVCRASEVTEGMADKLIGGVDGHIARSLWRENFTLKYGIEAWDKDIFLWYATVKRIEKP